MTEPYYPPKDIPHSDQLQKILEILKNYHTIIIQKYTLQSQKSKLSIDQTIETLSEKGKGLEKFLRSREIDESNKNDPEFMKCIEELKPNLESLSHEVSTLAPTWATMMFIEYPMSISDAHIKRLITMYKN